MTASENTRPRHVAIIMDGNGRWARQRGRPRASGHQAGFVATRGIVEACVRQKIDALTLFAFSSENWNRPQKEVGLLMDLFLRALKSEVSKLCENNVRICFIGERSAFQVKLQDEMNRAEQLTESNTGLELAIAVNYGGRWDIVNAARELARQARDGSLDPESIDIETFSRYVSLADTPEPDLFIRTGGEKRISNYLLWHLAYTELYFTDVLWPDFSDAELAKALEFYASRQRRFGLTGEQVTGNNA
ncbi:polyprenyl diphosphate synthase [Granulosicoccus antarcticus]|uniref:Ditrans,polycis-undecaprenyl-diphosphate synthase ((2E,6E)-farnesyl-diphosphate specific) n=1 Tax=Granulosicoccus antarcticus IMCC3135 TaxID=1192854 RepID=A0A2Z2P5R1_9GAMM|nr:polyprenyl diphosphate synthase [Granulosicoccus antarcticus]ASJ75164.1 Ditrans,polycis-undecaprenyl-diphosphate synthase ((2E,6E)-farnesyl-diphosphate specific) [Granulosicoccus antarcticus IMCC3135]